MLKILHHLFGQSIIGFIEDATATKNFIPVMALSA